MKNGLRAMLSALARIDFASNARKLKFFESLVPSTKSVGAAAKGQIFYVLNASLPHATSGYATRSHGVIGGLEENGCSVFAVTRPGFPIDVKRGIKRQDVALVERVGSIDYHRMLGCSATELKLADYIVAATSQLEASMKKVRPARVLAATPSHYTGLPALIAARRCGLPFYYEVRGLWEITKASRKPSFSTSADYQLRVGLEEMVCRHADHVFTLTPGLKEVLVERGVSALKISLVPNSCDLSLFPPVGKSQKLAKQLNFPEAAIVIGYVGSIVDYEGLDDLVEAFAQLKSRGRNVVLLIVGAETVKQRKPASVTDALRRSISGRNLDNDVIMPGRIPFDQVAEYYSLIDIAAFPRKPWPVCEIVSPLKPLEAMAMSKAVVGSSVRALAEMIDHGNTGRIFEKGSVSALSEALDGLVQDSDARHRLGQNARAWVQSQRTWKKSTEIMRNIMLLEQVSQHPK